MVGGGGGGLRPPQPTTRAVPVIGHENSTFQLKAAGPGSFYNYKYLLREETTNFTVIALTEVHID